MYIRIRLPQWRKYSAVVRISFRRILILCVIVVFWKRVASESHILLDILYFLPSRAAASCQREKATISLRRQLEKGSNVKNE